MVVLSKIRLMAMTRRKATALLAWEAACERLRNALLPPPGYPIATTEELDATFTNAAERLHTLRALATTPDE
jgi:hypothetical protein